MYQENYHNEGLIIWTTILVIALTFAGIIFMALDSKAVGVSASVPENSCNKCLKVCK